jgi:class 3 adenylate cyclase
VIDAHEGAVVKTMGDAVLASFTDARACARAAADALGAFETFRASHDHGELVGLKIGMYAGPAYVVTANGALDYFGQTVNVASRVQHLAGSGEIVIAKEHFATLADADKDRLTVTEEIVVTVKGVEQPLTLLRVHLAERLVPQAPASRARLDDVVRS